MRIGEMLADTEKRPSYSLSAYDPIIRHLSRHWKFNAFGYFYVLVMVNFFWLSVGEYSISLQDLYSFADAERRLWFLASDTILTTPILAAIFIWSSSALPAFWDKVKNIETEASFETIHLVEEFNLELYSKKRSRIHLYTLMVVGITYLVIVAAKVNDLASGETLTHYPYWYFEEWYLVFFFLLRRSLTLYMICSTVIYIAWSSWDARRLLDGIEIRPQLMHPDAVCGLRPITSLVGQFAFMAVLIGIGLFGLSALFIFYKTKPWADLRILSLVVVYLFLIPYAFLSLLMPIHVKMLRARHRLLKPFSVMYNRLALEELEAGKRSSEEFIRRNTLLEAIETRFRVIDSKVPSWPFPPKLRGGVSAAIALAYLANLASLLVSLGKLLQLP